MKAASELGKMIASHPAAKKVEEAVVKLQADVTAQRALNDFNRLMQKLEEKQASGQAVTEEEKKSIETLQAAVIKNSVLRQYQLAQMDYLDLMRQVDEVINGGGAAQEAPAAAPKAPSPLIQ
jgi:cell fate (sporulation/competence/biofilm development) regulator YlbF (YheA/YmcA/DUF963 family)